MQLRLRKEVPTMPKGAEYISVKYITHVKKT